MAEVHARNPEDRVTNMRNTWAAVNLNEKLATASG